MSSMVRASCPISAGPAVGMEVAKSPCPRRTAASVSASVGRVTRQPSNTPAISASTANTKAVRIRRHTSALTDLSVSVAEARVSMSAMPSPLDENTGKLDAYKSQAVDALHGESPVGHRLRMQRGEFVVGQRVEGAVVDEPHRQAAVFRERGGERVVEQVHHHHAERAVLRR